MFYYSTCSATRLAGEQVGQNTVYLRSIVAKKLNRSYAEIKINKEYCCWTEKRLALAGADSSIQGYSSGTFWERNTLNTQLKDGKKIRSIRQYWENQP